MENSIVLDIIATLQKLFVGYLPAAVLGVFVGIGIGINTVIYQFLVKLFQIPNTIPSIIFLPLVLIFFKEQETAAIFLIFLAVLWAIIIETATGIQKFREQDHNLKVAINHIFKALRTGLWVAWFTLIAIEMLIGTKGLGFLAWNAYKTNNPKDVIDAILYIVILGVLFDQFLDYLGYILSQIVKDKSSK